MIVGYLLAQGTTGGPVVLSKNPSVTQFWSSLLEPALSQGWWFKARKWMFGGTPVSLSLYIYVHVHITFLWLSMYNIYIYIYQTRNGKAHWSCPVHPFRFFSVPSISGSGLFPNEAHHQQPGIKWLNHPAGQIPVKSSHLHHFLRVTRPLF